MANSPTSECGPNLRVHLDENAAITKNNMVHNTSEDEDDVEVDIDGPDCEEPTALAGRISSLGGRVSVCVHSQGAMSG